MAADGERAAANETATQQAARERAARDAADDAAYGIAKSANTAGAYDAYLRDYPSGRNAASARSARATAIAAAAPPAYGAYDLSQLNSSVRTAAEASRAARAKAEIAAGRARTAAANGTRETFAVGTYAGEPRGKGTVSVGVFTFAASDPNKALRYEGEFSATGGLAGYGVYY